MSLNACDTRYRVKLRLGSEWFMPRVLWATILTLSLLTAAPASGERAYAWTGIPGTRMAVDIHGSISAPKVFDWKKEISLPDDILFVRHQGYSWPRDALIFLVSLNSEGKIASVRPISGFSLYLSALAGQIKQFSFSHDLVGTTFVLRVQDPKHKLWDTKLYHKEACTPTTDLRTLYELGALLWRDTDNDAAFNCYKYILAQNPSSIAARYGMADICLSRKDPCAYQYLTSVITSNPEFIEARKSLIWYRSKPDNLKYVAGLEELLKLDLPLDDRVSILGQQEFWLERMDRIDDAIGVIAKWNAAVSEMLSIYPPAVATYWLEGVHNGLLEEAEGLNERAIVSYHLAASAGSFDSLTPDSARYEIDLGLARTLRKTGHAEDALKFCNAWKKRWKKLISRPVHHPWELREDGPGELEGRWEFSCGSPQKGLELIQGAIKKYPDSNAPYTALAQYYYSVGDIEKARTAEATASRLLDEWAKRLGEF